MMTHESPMPGSKSSQAAIRFPPPTTGEALPITACDYEIASETKGIDLFLRNKRAFGQSEFRPERTVLYVHGATMASELVFDLPVDGVSWADDLAAQGWDVWMMDIRGYGRSTWPEAMRQPAGSNPPVATTDEAVADFAAAVGFVRSLRQLAKIQLIGWSWGSVIAGRFASLHPDLVHSLVLVTPLWANRQAAPHAAPPGAAWQEWTLAKSRTRSQTGVPEGQADLILPPASLALWETAVRASQPEAAGRRPERFRSPLGVMADPAWRGQAPYEAGRITAPTLIIRGEWDELTPRGMSLDLFSQLQGAALRCLIEIPRASHFVIAETARDTLFAETRSFLQRQDPVG